MLFVVDDEGAEKFNVEINGWIGKLDAGLVVDVCEYAVDENDGGVETVVAVVVEGELDSVAVVVVVVENCCL